MLLFYHLISVTIHFYKKTSTLATVQILKKNQSTEELTGIEFVDVYLF